MINNLNLLRKKINLIDKEIMALIAARFNIAREIGEFKKRKGRKATDVKREKKLRRLHKKWVKKLKINDKMINDIFKIIIKESKKVQNKF